MRRLLIYTLCLLVLCLTLPTAAQKPSSSAFSERHRLPKVETNPEGLKCLNTEQWQQVLKVSSQNKGLFEWRIEILGALAMHNDIIAKYELLLENYELQLKIVTQRNEYLDTRLDQERTAASRLSLEDRLEKYALWAVVLIETVFIGVMGVKMAVSAE